MTIADKIKQLRVDNNYKQTYVAHILKMKQPEYSKLENGKRKKIDVEYVKKLSDFYNIDIYEFFK